MNGINLGAKMIKKIKKFIRKFVVPREEYDIINNEKVALEIKYAEERKNNEIFAFKIHRTQQQIIKWEARKIGNLKLINFVRTHLK
tara:strand:+ start:263 stop:520 length:258 start_codon:yes stop_codon:yes gene_type:complete